MLSIKFDNVYINDFECIVGTNEKNGNINGIKHVINDFYYKEKSFEKALIRMQREVIYNLLLKNNLSFNRIDLIIGGDLTNQITSTTYALKNIDVSFIGIYGACSSFIESLILSSILIDNKVIKNCVSITSSHNLVAERQFRYPVEYGALKNENSTFTSTASVAALLSKNTTNIKVTKATIGKVVDLNVLDPNYIGAIMAPSCAETLYNHLINFNESIDNYDLVLTGDLGKVGLDILKDYLLEEYHIRLTKVKDAGASLYNKIEDINDGASGPCTLPLYLFYNILKNKKYKKILVIGTGALHSKTMVNQKESIPSISHAIEIRVK